MRARIICEAGSVAIGWIDRAAALKELLSAPDAPQMRHGSNAILRDLGATNVLANELVKPEALRLAVDISEVPVFDR